MKNIEVGVAEALIEVRSTKPQRGGVFWEGGVWLTHPHSHKEIFGIVKVLRFILEAFKSVINLFKHI